MPRMKVIKRIPAYYEEYYEVDAADRGEAKRAVEGGKVRFKTRSFCTIAPDCAMVVKGTAVMEAHEVLKSRVDYEIPKELMQSSAPFNNGFFTTKAGEPAQHVIQLNEDG